MKHPDPMSLPGNDVEREGGSQREAGRGDDFPIYLAEAIEILVDRAMRHGLIEVAHLLGVAALAARDPADSMVDQPHQPECKPNGVSSAPT